MKFKIKTIQPVVPTASMADIAFLLIIFFMLTTSFSPVKMSVDLASAANRTEVEKDAAIIAIAVSGELEVSDGVQQGNRINNMDELELFIEQTIAEDPNKQFIIKADRNIQYMRFNEVYERLRDKNCRRIALLTEQKTGSTGP